MVALEEKSGCHQTHFDSSSGTLWQSFQKLQRYFILNQGGGSTANQQLDDVTSRAQLLALQKKNQKKTANMKKGFKVIMFFYYREQTWQWLL